MGRAQRLSPQEAPTDSQASHLEPEPSSPGAPRRAQSGSQRFCQQWKPGHPPQPVLPVSLPPAKALSTSAPAQGQERPIWSGADGAPGVGRS